MLAMSAFGAGEAEIAAALDIAPSQLTASDRYHMESGVCIAEMNLLTQTWKRAEAGNVTAMLWSYRHIKRGDRAASGE